MELKEQSEKSLKFITIEGVDGAGKSSVITHIKNYLESKGESVILTREPGGTELGERLRTLLLNHKMDLMTETMLMFSARAEHIAEVIKPALDGNKWVICDRFTDSTLAYQCAAKGLSEQKVKTLQNLVQETVKPGLTFMLDVPLHVSKERLEKTKKVPDKFERETDDFFNKVINGYKDIAKKNPNRCKLVDASKSQEETLENVYLHLEEFYKKFSIKNQKKIKPN